MNNIYFTNKYIKRSHFLAINTQICTMFSLNPKKILEIGIGNNGVAILMKNYGFNYTTCDINKELKPDVVADIRNIPFRKDEFDLVCAFEVLEHLPFEEFENCLKELKRVSNKYIIISIPNATSFFSGLFKLSIPRFSRYFEFQINIPYRFFPYGRFKQNGVHCWEMNRKKCSKKVIKEKLNKHFKIIKEFNELLQPEHYYFILEVKQSEDLEV